MLVCRFKPAVAPRKAAVFSLVQSRDMDKVARRISTKLRRAGLADTVETAGERARPALCMASDVAAVVALRMIASTCTFISDLYSGACGGPCTPPTLPYSGMHWEVGGPYCLL